MPRPSAKFRYGTTVYGPTVRSIAESACEATEGIERNVAVARSDKRKRGVAEWYPAGKEGAEEISRLAGSPLPDG